MWLTHSTQLVSVGLCFLFRQRMSTGASLILKAQVPSTITQPRLVLLTHSGLQEGPFLSLKKSSLLWLSPSSNTSLIDQPWESPKTVDQSTPHSTLTVRNTLVVMLTFATEKKSMVITLTFLHYSIHTLWAAMVQETVQATDNSVLLTQDSVAPIQTLLVSSPHLDSPQLVPCAWLINSSESIKQLKYFLK